MICINDIFSEEQWKIFNEFNIIVPKKGQEYSVREVLKTRNGEALLLNEIVNPLIPNGFTDPEGTTFYFEPSWATWRFIEKENYLENVLELEEYV